jgi:hypothetical protein
MGITKKKYLNTIILIKTVAEVFLIRNLLTIRSFNFMLLQNTLCKAFWVMWIGILRLILVRYTFSAMDVLYWSYKHGAACVDAIKQVCRVAGGSAALAEREMRAGVAGRRRFPGTSLLLSGRFLHGQLLKSRVQLSLLPQLAPNCFIGRGNCCALGAKPEVLQVRNNLLFLCLVRQGSTHSDRKNSFPSLNGCRVGLETTECGC